MCMNKKKNKYIKIQEQTIKELQKIAIAASDNIAKILFCDIKGDIKDQKKELKAIDLSNITKIKKDADGGLEVTFIDRLKALTFLSELSRKLAETEQEKYIFDFVDEGAKKLAQKWEKQNG